LGDVLETDIVIAGTGAAGATLARALSNTNRRVLLLESGGATRDPAADALNEVENIGRLRIGDQWLARNRILGGTSHSWSGRCTPFDESDFGPRLWVEHSGWPLQGTALRPYLDRAAAYLGIVPGAGLATPAFWRSARRRAPALGLDPDILVPHLWSFSQDRANAREPTRFGRHLAGDLGPNVTLLTHATLCDIELNEACTRLTGVQIMLAGGERRHVRAAQLVLACGGIENARLLLNADRQMKAGIGNQNDQVGRYLMDHLRGPTAHIAVRASAGLQRRLGHYRLAGSHVFALGLRLSPVRQAAEGLLNAAAWVDGRIAQDDPWIALKSLAQGRIGALPPIIRNAGLLPAGLFERLVARRGLPRKLDRLELICMCEQVPDPQSRVQLATARDATGLRRARIDWRVHDQEVLTLRRLTMLIICEFKRLGWPVPHPEDWVRDHQAIPDRFLDVAHPTGTTRMGRDPASSVVNEHGEVHGVSGLYVAGSSIFPTAGHANPTLMIVAMALRLADHLMMPAAAVCTAGLHARSYAQDIMNDRQTKP
jgi:choline dehydrogenase-like flavoprotein